MKLPVKTQTFLLNGEYQGFEFEARVNPPWGQFLDRLEATEKADQTKPQEILDRLYDLVEMMAVGWNFVDERGRDIPLSRAGMRLLPLELLQMLILRTREVIEKVPLASSEGSSGQSAREKAVRLNTSRLKSAARSAKSPAK